jgi:predicted secreted protein
MTSTHPDREPEDPAVKLQHMKFQPVEQDNHKAVYRAIIEDDHAPGKPVYALKSGKLAPEESPGTETWHFRAAKPGEQTVRLEYQRGMGQSVAERRFGFTATVR